MAPGNASVPDIAIRDATVDDSEPIARFVCELGYHTSVSQMRKRLESIRSDDGYNTLVACDGVEIVGFIGTRIGFLYEGDRPYGQIMALAVARGHHRRGVGRMLIKAAESVLVGRGAQVLAVTSGNQRSDAHAFYEGCGYTFTGRSYKKSVPLSA